MSDAPEFKFLRDSLERVYAGLSPRGTSDWAQIKDAMKALEQLERERDEARAVVTKLMKEYVRPKDSISLPWTHD